MASFFRIISLLAALFAAVPSMADEPSLVQSAPVVVDISGLSSPRETMETFLTAMQAVEEGRPESFQKAESTLNLEGINVLVRAEKANEIAWLLLEVLNRSGPVELKKIPAKTKDKLFVYRQFESGDLALEKKSDGRWLFSYGTVRDLPAMLDEIPEPIQPDADPEASQTHLPWYIRMRGRFPEPLRHEWLLLENWQWLGILLIVAVGSMFDKLVTRLLKGVVRVWRRRGKLAELWLLPDDWLRPLGLLVMAGVWWVGINALGLKTAALVVLLVAVKLMAGLSGIWSSYRLVDFASAYLQHQARKSRNKLDDVLAPLFRKSLKVLVTVIGMLFFASALNLNISGLIAGLGLGGLAFALAAKDMVQNLFGSVTVLLDQSFHVGDWVVIGDVEGTVEEVGLRSTRIRTFYNSVIILPNSTLITASIDNMGRRRFRRYTCKLSLVYQTPPEKVEAFCEAVRELVRLHPHTRKDYYQVYLNDLAASSLDILVYIFWEAPDWSTELRERHRFLVDVLRTAEALGVEFAYPTQTIHWQAQEADSQPGPARKVEDLDGPFRDGASAARAIVEQAVDPNRKAASVPVAKLD